MNWQGVFSFNCLNGTVNLHTGELRPHSPSDLNTRLAPVAYVPGTTDPKWQAFLEQVTGGDTELQDYLHAITRKLKLDPHTNREVVFELQTHLEEKIRELEEEGLNYSEALSRAVQDLGHPDLIAKGMYSVHSRGSWLDILLATLPHLLLASLFALHLWTRYLLIFVLLVGVTFVTLRGWKSGRPKWTYTWLGYSMAAPALSWLFALAALGYGTWIFFTTGALPFSVPIFMLIVAYIPFSLWIMANVIMRVVKQDWLLASLTALPFPFLTSWMLFLNWQGGIWAGSSPKVQETDGDRALVFLALAVTTGVFLKVGHRLLKIGLLTAATAVLIGFTMVAIPLSFGVLAIILITIASMAFLLSPAILQSRLDRQKTSYPPGETGEEVVPDWFTNAR